MRGYNEFRFNEATMVDAIQEYLDKRMPNDSPKVTGVVSEGTGRYDGVTFTIKTEGRKAADDHA